MDEFTTIPAPEASSARSTDDLRRSRTSLILRCQRIIFSAYRTDQYSDPDGYMTSLGAVLEQYPNDVIAYVSDPRTGVQRDCKWPPTIAEITEACDRRVAALERANRFDTWGARNEPRRLEPPMVADLDLPGRLAQVFVPTDHKRFAELVNWSKSAATKWWKFGESSDGRRGIWVPWNIWADGARS